MGSSTINSSLDDQLHREDSFSFTSCFDLNSAPSVFSEDDDYASADDDASYIEIALGNDGDYGDDSGEFELRISLSTSDTKTQQNYPAVFETDHTTTPSSSSSSSTFTFSCSSSTACSLAGAPSEIGKEKLIDINQWELVRSRKPSKSTNTMAMNGGFTRWFIVKFQAIKVRNLLASFAKPLQVNSSQGNSGGSTTDQHKKKRSKEIIDQYYQRLIKPFDKWIDQRSNQGNRDIKNSLRGGSGGDQRYSRVLEINLDPVRGVLEAVSMGMGIGRKDRQARSCPTSIESSPVHRGSFPSGSKLHTGENSIEAAIAHCKTSFAQKPRFCP
ncbi:hypothetical protein FH972_016993 [Carpinus fangiana]|uniref:Uncharacterized protein n=1 Tax=Carpinus fangiana TaxID=176857 RepID=A0A5N6RHL8_9ROSI|nr:hypothetical protein FH972_016993 [Carpinus fangiana]